MSYNNSLNSNNSDLQEVIQLLEALPNAEKYQEKTIIPSTEEQIITFDDGYDGLRSVIVIGDEDLKSENIKYKESIFGIWGTYLNPDNGVLSSYSNDEDALITRSVSGAYVNDRVISIGDRAFQYCSSLTSVSFPKCTTIDSYAFGSCYSLTTVSFPVCTTIGRGAFYRCSKLTSASFPACTSISSYAFEQCSKLTTVSFPVCTSIGNYAFYDCYSLTTVSFPVCTNIGSFAFSYCDSLTTVSFPKCTYIGDYAFNRCSKLTKVSFPVCTSIGNYAFQSCRTLSSLTLGASTVCTLLDNDAFLSTPYAGYSSYFSGIPYIYVPSSLVASYKAATNWTYFSSYIVGV